MPFKRNGILVMSSETVLGASRQRAFWMQRSRWLDLAGLVFSGMFALVTFVIAAPMDPEPYHDGSQLPAAIAVSNGMVVHKDVFSGYGFLTAWVQGAAVWLFGPNLLTIRLLTAALLVIVAVLFYVIVRWAMGSIAVGVGLVALWVVAWPGRSVIWGTPLLPWPSVLYLVFQLGAVLLVARALLYPLRRTALLFAAGILVGLAVLTRINYGAAFIVALALVLAIVTKKAGLQPRHWISAVAGTLAAVVVPLVLIGTQGALAPFWDQSVVGPLSGQAIVKATEWFYLKNAYFWGSVILLVSLLFAVWAGSRNWIQTRLFLAFVSLEVFGLILWTSSALEDSPVRLLILSKLTWSPAIDGQAMQPLFLAAILSPFFLIALVVNLIVRVVKQRDSLVEVDTPETLIRRVFMVLLTLTSLASLVQIYPIADPNHLWWASPLPLALLVFAIWVSVGKRTRWAAVAIIVVPGVVISILTGVVFLAEPRTLITTGIMSGMRIQDLLAPNVAKVDALLADVQPGSADFICKEGLFAVWNGKYLASTPGYVDYAYRLGSASAGSVSQRTFLCVTAGDREAGPEYAARHGLRIVGESGDIELSYFTNVNILEMQPISRLSK
jgi:hypothetical protein